MSINIGAEPAPDFSDPVGLLVACHNRILGFCDLIDRLVEVKESDGATSEVTDAARKVVTYFSTAGKLHHEDEEKDFFPILNRVSLKMADAIQALIKDHETLDEAWAALEPLLKNIYKLEDTSELKQAAATFCQLSREHVRKEAGSFLDIAPHIISNKQMQEIGRSMAKRRGLSY